MAGRAGEEEELAEEWSFSVESLGFGRGESLPGPILQPPATFPVSIKRYCKNTVVLP